MSYTYSAVRRLDFTAGKFARPGPEKPECVLSTDRRSGPYLCQSHSLGLERLRLRQDLREVLFCCLTRERRRRREGSQEGRPQLKFPLCLCLEASLAVAWETVRSPRMHFIIHISYGSENGQHSFLGGNEFCLDEAKNYRLWREWKAKARLLPDRVKRRVVLKGNLLR